jgi:hypothetical protein
MALVSYNFPEVSKEENRNLPGMANFSYLFKIFNQKLVILDRTRTISIPVKVKSLFPLPAFRPINKTYEDLCNERALEILRRADELDAALYVAWSGGIDSTCVLVSLLKNATAVQKERIVVLLSEESIVEYPQFYEEHIRGKLQRESSAMLPSILGSKGRHVLTNGELNDQLFGSGLSCALLTKILGKTVIHEPYQRDVLFQFYNQSVGDARVTNLYLDLLYRLMDASPVPLTTYFHWFWWIMFALDWQSVFFRVFLFTAERNAQNITPEYVRTNVMPFFGTENFQLWSMNNLDKRVKDTMNTYKWPAKDIIYDYTKDAEYHTNKMKKASVSIWMQHNPFKFLDESMHLHRQIDPSDYYNPENSFI